MDFHATPHGNPRECPKTVKGKCSKCGGEVESEYGCCKYGIGEFLRCVQCGQAHNLKPDQVDSHFGSGYDA